jgi:hypothetical protein
MESITTINGVDHQIESSNNTPTTNHIDEQSTDDICPCDNHENSSTTKLDNDKELILKLDYLMMKMIMKYIIIHINLKKKCHQ